MRIRLGILRVMKRSLGRRREGIVGGMGAIEMVLWIVVDDYLVWRGVSS